MYAIIQTGGKQYRVSEGDYLRVEKLTAEPGDEIELADVLLVSGEGGVRTGAEGVKVKATVVDHARGDKVIVFKFKRRKMYRRKRGHRQWYTGLRIDEIDLGDARKAKAAKKSEPSKPEVSAKAEPSKKEAKGAAATPKAPGEKKVAEAKPKRKPAARKTAKAAAKKTAAPKSEKKGAASSGKAAAKKAAAPKSKKKEAASSSRAADKKGEESAAGAEE